MKKFFMALFFISPVFAQQKLWISDSLRTSVNREAGLNKAFVATLNAGDEVQKLETSKDGEYIKVKKGDVVGWIHARNTMNTPSIHAQYQTLSKQFAQQSAKLEALLQQNQDLNHLQENQQNTLGSLQQQMAQLQQQSQLAKDELLALQHASANVVAIDKRNRELETLIASTEQQNLALRHRNSHLEEEHSQKQMYIGGLLVFLGFVLYWLLDHFHINKSSRNYFNNL